MKKFIYKVGILICLTGIFILGINLLYRRSLPGSEDVPKNIQIANMGSSHAYYGLCYDELEKYRGGVYSFNFALSGQVPTYDVRLLKMYKDNLMQGGICLIPVSYFSFVWQEEKIEGFEVKNSRYYRILDYKYIKNYSFEEDVRYNLLPGLYAGEALLDRNRNKDRIESFADEEREERWYHKALDMDVEENAKLAYQGQVSDWNNVILQEEIEAVYEMIALCREQNVTPVLITFPFTREFNDCADENLKPIFYDIIADIERETETVWYDYSKDTRFIDNKQYFMDSNHLNKIGAKYFTKIIKCEIMDKILEK